ncbi:MAG TPA: nodulation protein NfeD [Thermoanaerobaculia bacterium]
MYPKTHSPARLSRNAALASLVLGSIGLLAPLFLAAQPGNSGEVLVVRVKSAIQPVSAELIQDAILEADRSGAAALVIELDTPGGLMTSTRDITSAILGARTPVAVYVGPSGAQAASAGFFLLMAADVAAMAPGTNAGAAHPVDGSGKDIDGNMGKKIEQDAAANIRSLAARNGRNVQLAESTVLESRSFSAQEALQNKLIDLVSPNVPALVKSLNGRVVRRGEALVPIRTAGAEIRRIEISPLRAFLGVLADPNITYLLLGLGSLGLFFEITHPGGIFPGVVGVLCLILSFYGLSVLPVNYAGLALILVAIVLFILEIKVTSYGMLTVAGVIALVLGSLMLFKTPEPALRVSVELIATLSVFTLLVVGFLAFMAVRVLKTPVATGVEGMIHEVGIARSDLAPRGKVFVHGELWDAVADEPVPAGERVEVVAVRNLTLAVRRRRDSVA